MNQPGRSERLAGEIRAELGRQRKTVRGLAKHLHIGEVTLWRRMTGVSEFRLDELASVADFLGLSVSELTERTEPTERRTA